MPETYTAFFYGTLLHPKILQGVIGHPGQDLQICPALILEHTRHQIKHADYPAMLPYTQSSALFSQELKVDDRTVRGTLVKGLSDSDIALLDQFEGDEYTLEKVQVHPLKPFKPLSSSSPNDIPLDPPPLPPLDELPAPIEAKTYIWAGKLSDLRPDLWEYADFMRYNAAKWIKDTNPVAAEHQRGIDGTHTVTKEIIVTDEGKQVKVTIE
ncbi:hypothetical protein CERSUDRAFT_160235 [Gelatoporia subvermispora B]|uniref:Putative gamma-glutamylcyclotransferase n=1 Tax=Ceriporiopsis subvermispora (strain B) TaxID=914234 RepID=M2R583_CERS8|nr:hypothetical protein CERSUDRAFT_160235 [Gelatoporia subvermispora B]